MLNKEKEFIQNYLENSKEITINTARGLNPPELGSILANINKAKKNLNNFNKLTSKKNHQVIVCLVSLLETSMEVYENYPSYRSFELLTYIANGIICAGALGKHNTQAASLLDEMLNRYASISEIMSNWGIIHR